MSDINVALRLSLDDQASPGLKKVAQAAQKTSEKTATATQKAAAHAAAAAARGAAQQQNAFQRMARARQKLGIRSERAIQREIQRTEAAYNRLKASGTLTWREQARAADQMRSRVTSLTNEMGKLTRAQKAIRALKFGASFAAGLGAAGYTLKAPIDRAMDFNKRRAYAALTAFSDRDDEGKRLGEEAIEAAVNKSIQEGGTRDQALEAFNTITASGVMSAMDALAVLPDIMRVKTATNADPQEIARIGIAAKQNMQIDPKNFRKIFNIAATGGKMGSFEMADMAQHLPDLLAKAAALGLSGPEGVAKIVAMAQASMTNTGNTATAANNVANILDKIKANETTQRFGKYGINLQREILAGKAQGRDALDVFGSAVDRVIARDPKYQALQKQLAGAKDDKEKTALFKEMSKIAESFGIGKIITDRQALAGFMAWRNDPKTNEAIQREALGNESVIDQDAAYINKQAWRQRERAEENLEAARKKQIDKLMPAIGTTAEKFADLAQKHTELTGAIALATPAVAAFTATMGVSSALMGGGNLSIRDSIGAMRSAGGALQSSAQFLVHQGFPALVNAGVAGIQLVAAAGAGYVAGTVINAGINKMVQAATGGKFDSLGEGFHYVMNYKDLRKLNSPIERSRRDPFINPANPIEALKKPEPAEVKGVFKIDLPDGFRLVRQSTQMSGGNFTVETNTGNLFSREYP